jgi:hypothetical protein
MEGPIASLQSVCRCRSSSSPISLIATTATGLSKDTRDTPMRRTRHRDGRLLKGGVGLTTGLGWSDRLVFMFFTGELSGFVSFICCFLVALYSVVCLCTSAMFRRCFVLVVQGRAIERLCLLFNFCRSLIRLFTTAKTKTHLPRSLAASRLSTSPGNPPLLPSTPRTRTLTLDPLPGSTRYPDRTAAVRYTTRISTRMMPMDWMSLGGSGTAANGRPRRSQTLSKTNPKYGCPRLSRLRHPRFLRRRGRSVVLRSAPVGGRARAVRALGFRWK